MKVVLTQVTRQTKEGAKGPYVRLLIKTQEHGDKILSGFGGAYTDQWKKGDSVEIEEEEVEVGGKKYLNFKPVFPKKENTDKVLASLEELHEKIDKITDYLLIVKQEAPHPDYP